MARIRDLEEFEALVISQLQQHLSAKITALNAEKNDDVTLQAIDTYIAFPMVRLSDSNLYIVYRMNKPEILNQSAGLSSLKASIDIYVVINNIENSTSMRKQLYRYSRACREVFKQASNDRKLGTIFTISDFPPDLYNFAGNSSNLSKAAGISVSAQFAC